MNLVYIALGSNLGKRSENLKSAIHQLFPEVRILRCSPVYETPPWGYEDQPDFLNQVIEVETDLSPDKLLEQVKSIERKIGRKDSFRYGPRMIDIDILFYNDLIIDSPPLSIPHPRIPDRSFVLVPMADLAPLFTHPVHNRTIEDLLREVDTIGIQYHSPGECSQIDE